MHNFLISFATITAIGAAALLYRLIENEFGSNIGFLSGFIIDYGQCLLHKHPTLVTIITSSCLVNRKAHTVTFLSDCRSTIPPPIDSGAMTVGKLLIPVAVMTSILIGMAIYRFMEYTYGANISFLVGFTILITSAYFINTHDR